MTEDPNALLVERVVRVTALIGLATAAGFAALGGLGGGVGSLAGTGVAIGNVWLVSRQVKRLISGDLPGWSAILFVFKLGALFAVLYLLIVVLDLDPIAVSAGFSTLVVAIGVCAVVPTARAGRGEE